MSTAPAELSFHLHPKQAYAFQTKGTEVLYGGAAGGGKSHLMRVAALVWCCQIPGLQVYLFRRHYGDLIANHLDGPTGFRAMCADLEKSGLVKIVQEEIRFWNGAKIHLCHCEHDESRWNYLGAEMHVLLIDELTLLSEVVYRFLRSRVRMTGLEVPPEYEGMFPRILCGSNPGNRGHLFVKDMFVDAAPAYEIWRTPDEEGGMLRQFIPATLDDNPTLMETDPTYRQRLRGLGSEALVRAMEDGDWNIVEGAFFDCWSQRRHVLRPFEIPDEWPRFRAGDWGGGPHPGWYGWFAVVTDDYPVPDDLAADTGRVLPRGSLVLYRELYTAKKTGSIWIGEKIAAEEAARRILSSETRQETAAIASGVLDPSAFAVAGGPSIAERMARQGVAFRRADNRRVGGRGPISGWNQVTTRLQGDEDGAPMLYVFSTCVHVIRTLPALQHDKLRPEDVDTNMEDHPADGVRYACMSRPWLPKRRQADVAKFPGQGTFMQEYQHNLRQMEGRRSRI